MKKRTKKVVNKISMEQKIVSKEKGLNDAEQTGNTKANKQNLLTT